MTITIDSPFKHPPRISEQKFVQVLQSVGSFDADALWGPYSRDQRPDEARRIYQYIVAEGHDPAVLLAIAGKEHTFGTNVNSVLHRGNTRSWTNARTVRHPDVKKRAMIITDAVRKSQYVRYAHVHDSVLDGLYRVDEPGFAYRKANATSIVDHIRIWAPGSDNNKPEQYAQTMCDWINEWAAADSGEKPQPVPPAVPPKEQPMHVGIPGVPFVAADARHHKPGRNDPWPYYLIQHHTDGFDSLNWLTTSPNSQVSATYLLRNDGTVRAQLVSHTDTPWTTGRMNDDSISCEWERYWTDPARRQFANGVPDSVYQNIGAFWAEVVRVERARGNPHFQNTPVKDQVRDHNDFYQTACPGNLDMNRVYTELVKALESDVTPDVPPAEPENPNAKFFEDTGHWIVNDAYDGVQVDMLDFYEREGGIIQIGLPLEGMHQDADGVYRQAMENAILEFWPHGFGNVTGPLYRFGRYLDHVDRLRDAA